VENFEYEEADKELENPEENFRITI